MSTIWLLIFALAICSFAHAEDYDYDELVSEEPIQVISNKIDWSLFLQSNQNVTIVCHCVYSNVPNKRACTFISGKVCPLTLIEPKRQTLLEINMHARLFGTLE